MKIFWLLIILFTIVAVLFIVFPFIRGQVKESSTSRRADLSIYLAKLRDLQDKYKNGDLTLEQFEAAEIKLSKSYQLNNPDENTRQIKAKRIVGIFVILIFVIGSIAAYLHWGSSTQVAQYKQAEQQQQFIQQQVASLGSTKNIIQALQQKLAKNPSDGHGWYLLGKLYLDQGQIANAMHALATANKISPNQPDIMLAYAESLYFYSHHRLNHRAKSLVTQVLKIQPNNINAINLLALDAYSHKRYQVAINYWQPLLSQFAPDSQDYQVIQAMISKAQQNMSGQMADVKLNVQVELADNLRDQVSPDDAVYIFAKAVNGPEMPLAVTRSKVSDLPLTVSLSNKNAMMPTLTLADFNQVQIFARVSKSGTAQSQLGDLEGESEVIQPQQANNSPITIVINHVIE